MYNPKQPRHKFTLVVFLWKRDEKVGAAPLKSHGDFTATTVADPNFVRVWSRLLRPALTQKLVII